MTFKLLRQRPRMLTNKFSVTPVGIFWVSYLPGLLKVPSTRGFQSQLPFAEPKDLQLWPALRLCLLNASSQLLKTCLPPQQSVVIEPLLGANSFVLQGQPPMLLIDSQQLQGHPPEALARVAALKLESLL